MFFFRVHTYYNNNEICFFLLMTHMDEYVRFFYIYITYVMCVVPPQKEPGWPPPPPAHLQPPPRPGVAAPALGAIGVRGAAYLRSRSLRAHVGGGDCTGRRLQLSMRHRTVISLSHNVHGHTNVHSFFSNIIFQIFNTRILRYFLHTFVHHYYFPSYTTLSVSNYFEYQRQLRTQS